MGVVSVGEMEAGKSQGGGVLGEFLREKLVFAIPYEIVGGPGGFLVGAASVQTSGAWLLKNPARSMWGLRAGTPVGANG